MTPGDTVYFLNGRRIEAVVFVARHRDYATIRRREPGYPDLQEYDIKPYNVFDTPDAARAELHRRREERIAKLTRLLERERAFDPDGQPVRDLTKPPKRGAR